MRAAILGVGRMGRRHIKALLQLQLELSGVFDLSTDSLKACADEFAFRPDQLFANRDRLYAEVRPECVVIATTADSHCELVCEAAERGVKLILVEKPMAVSLQQCDRMLEVCRRHGAQLSVNHQMRFMEQYILPKRLFAQGAYGGLSSMTVIGGNCGLSMNGTHYLEAFRFIAGEAAAEVSAWFSPERVANPRGPQFEDRAGCLRVVSAGGKRFYMEIGADQGHGVHVVYAGRNGLVTVDELTGHMSCSHREEQYLGLPTTRYGMPAVNTQRLIKPAEIIESSAAVLRALIDGTNVVTGEDGRMAVKTLVAAYQSAEQGGVPIRLDGSLDNGRLFPWA